MAFAMQTFIATMANACTVTIGLSPAVTCNPLQGLAAHAQSTQILLEAARDAEITDANARVVIPQSAAGYGLRQD